MFQLQQPLPSPVWKYTVLDYTPGQADETVSHVMGAIVDVQSGYDIRDTFPSVRTRMYEQQQEIKELRASLSAMDTRLQEAEDNVEDLQVSLRGGRLGTTERSGR